MAATGPAGFRYRTGPLPQPPSIILNTPNLRSAWIRLHEILEGYRREARQLQDWISRPLRYRSRGIEGYTKLAHGTLTYTSNTVLIVGGRGSGKSTLLASLFHHYRQLLLNYLDSWRYAGADNGHEEVPRFIPVAVIDPSTVPPADRVANWVAAAYKELVETITGSLASEGEEGYDTASEQLRESLENFMRSTGVLPVNPTELLAISADLDDYLENTKYALEAGYDLIQHYIALSYNMRKALRKLLRLNPEEFLLLIGLDSIDLAPQRLLEVLLFCRLLSLDPYTVCIYTARDQALLQQLLETQVATYIDISRGASGSRHNVQDTNATKIVKAVTTNLYGKVSPPPINIVKLPEIRPQELESFMPIEIASLCEEEGITKERGKEACSRLGALLQRHCIIVGTGKKKEGKVSIYNYLFRAIGNGKEPTIYARLFRHPRCLKNLYMYVSSLPRCYDETEDRGHAGMDARTAVSYLLGVLAACAASGHQDQLQLVADALLDGHTVTLRYTAMTKPARHAGLSMLVEGSPVVLRYSKPEDIRVHVVQPLEITNREALATALIAEIAVDAGLARPPLVEAEPLLVLSSEAGETGLPSPPLWRFGHYASLAAITAETVQKIAQTTGSNLLDCTGAYEASFKLVFSYIAASLLAAASRLAEASHAAAEIAGLQPDQLVYYYKYMADVYGLSPGLEDVCTTRPRARLDGAKAETAVADVVGRASIEQRRHAMRHEALEVLKKLPRIGSRWRGVEEGSLRSWLLDMLRLLEHDEKAPILFPVRLAAATFLRLYLAGEWPPKVA